MDAKKVIILDDHTLFLKGMTLILEDCCSKCEVFAYQSIKEIVNSSINFNKFDLLISDIELPNENIFEFFATLKSNYPKLPILAVTMHKKNSIIKKCKALNIEGYLLKNEDEQLTEAIDIIINGGKYYSKTVVEFCKKTNSISINLSSREEDIIKLVANGYNIKEIADKLFLSEGTVKTHKRNIKIKLNLDYNHDIIEYAHKNYVI